MEITDFEIWLRSQLRSLPELVEAVGDRIFNSVAGQSAVFPFLIFTVIPLQDSFGQARTSIQTRLLVDIKITSRLPLQSAVNTAVAALKEHFRQTTGAVMNGTAISIRHERPISRTEPGAAADEKLLSRGGTFRVWLSQI